MSFFSSLELLPDDPILALPLLFADEKNPQKVNLGIGVYKDAEGKPLVLTAVRHAEEQIIEQSLNKEYQPIEGSAPFLKVCKQLQLGQGSPLVDSPEVFAFQTVGGTGALRVGSEFLAQAGFRQIFLSTPTWPNHKAIFERVGLKAYEYPYYDRLKHEFDFDALCDAIGHMPPKSVILLQASCHNPSGIDPSIEQWQVLSQLLKKKQILPFFDLAYQGFGDGFEKDAASVRLFATEGHQMVIAQSFSKNMGLYGERMGCGCVITDSTESAKRVRSQIKQLIRTNYSNPCLFGSRIVTTICQDARLRQEWLDELDNMRLRIHEMRRAFHASLLAYGIQGNMEFMLNQKGIFSLIGLQPHQVSLLRKEYGIYLPQDGRINVAGITMKNLDYVSQAFVRAMSSD